MATKSDNLPEGIYSLLDTDLYKLTMQCCILKFFPDVSVTYSFTNRTPDKKLNRAAFRWLQAQVESKAGPFLPDHALT
jgi:nicotinate phosphoribosyltransferase